MCGTTNPPYEAGDRVRCRDTKDKCSWDHLLWSLQRIAGKRGATGQKGLFAARRSARLHHRLGRERLDPLTHPRHPHRPHHGRLVHLDHDFIGRDALVKAKDNVRYAKVTLVFANDDVRRVLGDDFVLSSARQRIETGEGSIGTTYHTASQHPYAVPALSLVAPEHATPGTRVSVVWGDQAGSDLPRIRATVQPAPYNEHARTEYRR
ncbi:hypothetical protein Ade02nite_71580 [Paractinoplanes deccanensis]|uniref:Glycine cleavage T-protein C-terminal barrel domain-containing protein n=1 Tax=Paractinoplanes deccanensis TaxID=113561 RepID=A0ABQ3YET2_9ACTN|nr:hypothetical protein [Actinoplanes deccanensis]GID78517.1 hypothetical protein Ade02nite_71580 [Actinoplanes deccanensis]